MGKTHDHPVSSFCLSRAIALEGTPKGGRNCVHLVAANTGEQPQLYFQGSTSHQ